MAYELAATSVTGGLVDRLKELFPDVAIYREAVPGQRLQYPHFFAHQLTADTQAERRHSRVVSYLATIRYHHTADPVTDYAGLQERLDAVGIALLSELDHIYWDGDLVRISTPRVEKVDGVLHWFGNITVLTSTPVERDPTQGQIDVNITTKEDY